MKEKLPVKLGLSTLRPMTYSQALNYGLRNMPIELRRAGFQCIIYPASEDINGWTGYRINYAK